VNNGVKCDVICCGLDVVCCGLGVIVRRLTPVFLLILYILYIYIYINNIKTRKKKKKESEKQLMSVFELGVNSNSRILSNFSTKSGNRFFLKITKSSFG